MKKTLITLLFASAFAFAAWAEGSESFENASWYETVIGTFSHTGDNGMTWTIVGTTDYFISGNIGAVLHAFGEDGNSCDNSITGRFNSAQLAQGVGTVSFKVTGATGATVGWGNRNFTVTVGSKSIKKAVNISGSGPVVTPSFDINLTAKELSSDTKLIISVEGVVKGESAIIVDDVTWTSYSGLTDTPTMSIAAYQDQNTKIYWGTEVVANFASTTPDATFFYTLDGNAPTKSSASGASVSLPLDATTNLQVIAVTDAKGESEVANFSVTTAKGLISSFDGTAAKPNDRWTSTNISSESNTSKSGSISKSPYFSFPNADANLITEDFLSPQAVSLYIGANNNFSMKASFQTGNFKVIDGAYVWQPATDEWIEFGSNTGNAQNLKRLDFTLPDSIKNRRVRFKFSSSKYLYLDDITVVTLPDEAVATPTFSQASGDVAAGTSITVTCPADATLHYSVNGADWKTSTADVAIEINGKTIITAYATQDGKFDSYIAEANYQMPTTKSPEFSIATGSTLYQGDELTIASATEGATVVYRINKDEEQSGSSPIKLTIDGQIDSITAYCTSSGLLDSEPVTVRYNTAKVETPKFDNTSEMVVKGAEITVYSPTSSSRVYYRIDNGEWQYKDVSANVVIEKSCTITAYATRDNYLQSELISHHYSVALGQLPTPTANVENNSLVNAGSEVTLTFQNGATLNYRVNSGEWQKVENQTTCTLTITENCTIEAYTSQTDYVDSETLTLNYRIAKGKVETPYVVSGETEVATGTMVTIKTATEGAKLYYEVDGDGVWVGPRDVAAPIISSATTIRAYAVCDNYFTSDTLTVTFTIKKTTPTAIAESENDVVVYTEPRQIVIEGVDNADVAVYTVLGNLVQKERIASSRTIISVPTAGIYLVRIDGALHKVIVRD